MKTLYPDTAPTPFGPARACQVWNQRDPGPDQDLPLTPGEVRYVTELWHRMGGSYCWMAAFHMIRQGRVRELDTSNQES